MHVGRRCSSNSSGESREPPWNRSGLVLWTIPCRQAELRFHVDRCLTVPFGNLCVCVCVPVSGPSGPFPSQRSVPGRETPNTRHVVLIRLDPPAHHLQCRRRRRRLGKVPRQLAPVWKHGDCLVSIAGVHAAFLYAPFGKTDLARSGRPALHPLRTFPSVIWFSLCPSFVASMCEIVRVQCLRSLAKQWAGAVQPRRRLHNIVPCGPCGRSVVACHRPDIVKVIRSPKLAHA